ncbi:MAG: tetratricopeptide repeat protein [Candidatus Nealsonbacteria bacterium]|nr:tetratricopeptide repeat protein [Candidatus Nealsonbacteria bacterium]
MTATNSSPIHRRLLPAALLIAAVVGVFFQVAEYKFLHWDDRQHIETNPNLNPVCWRGVGEFWQRPYLGLYIPLSYTFFAAEAFGGGGSPAVFHVGNLALHVGCVLLVFVILRRLFGHDGAAAMGALLFGLHPVQVESVAWISETRGVLCGLFSLAAVWQYLCYADEPSPSRSSKLHYAAATACFVLALLAKPVAVAVPLVALAITGATKGSGLFVLQSTPEPAHVSLKQRVLTPLFLPWLLLAVAWVVVTKWQQPDAAMTFVAPLWARPLIAGDALTHYLYKLVAPVELAPDYGRSPSWVMSHWWFYAAWAVPTALVAALACLRNRRVWLTSAAVSVAWLLPVLGFVPFEFQRVSTVADRYFYLAMLGPALALAWFLARHWTRGVLTVAASILGLLAVLSFLQTAHWQSDEALIDHTLQVNEHSAMAKQHQGFLLAKDGKHAAAVWLYRGAVQEHPQHELLHASLAQSYVALGEHEEAIDVLRAALQEHPRWPLARHTLGDVLRQQGAIDEAEKEYRAVLKHTPDYAASHLALGKILFDRGDVDEAIHHYKKTLDDVFVRVQGHENLGVAMEALGRPNAAIGHFRTALELNPDAANAHYNLANVLFRQGRPDEAIEHYRSALEIAPHHGPARLNLGSALLAQGDTAAAIREFRAVIRQEPTLAIGHAKLGIALTAEGKLEEAKVVLHKALSLVPEDSDLARQLKGAIAEIEQR